MNRNIYIKQTVRNLSCSRSQRKEFARQLASDIESALESGESWEAIQNRLGTPAQIAGEINESFRETDVPRRRGKNVLILIFVIAAVAVVSTLLFIMWRQKQNNPVSRKQNMVSSDAAKEKKLLSFEDAQSLSTDAVEQFDSGDYQAVLDLGDDRLKNSLSVETLSQARKQIMPDADKLESVAIGNTVRTEEGAVSYVTVQIKVRYSNQTVTFTLSWNDRKQLCGFYLK